MKNPMPTLLLAGLLPSLAINAFAQVAEAPAAPDAPPAPAAPAASPASGTSSFTQKIARIDDKRTGVTVQRLQNIITRDNPSGSLVIPKDEADAKALTDSEEDLNIMAHLLDKVASSPDGKPLRAMGIMVHGPFNNTRVPRNLYIDGYGALFFLDVGYPLSPPPPGGDKAKATTEPPSEWDEARRELSQPGPSDTISISEFGVTTASSGEPYDADRVDQLQKSLVGELKNAAHIRSLKSNETVTIVVTGHGLAHFREVGTARKSEGGGGGFFYQPGGGAGGFGGSGSGSSGGRVMVRPAGSDDRGNQMILRATKSDIDAFQNGKLSYDEFRKKVTVLIY